LTCFTGVRHYYDDLDASTTYHNHLDMSAAIDVSNRRQNDDDDIEFFTVGLFA
jgi:hypothetical protein